MFNKETEDFIRKNYGISDKVIEMAERAEEELKEKFAEVDGITEYNQYKVLHAMQKNRLSDEGIRLKTYMPMYSMRKAGL